MYGVVLLMAMTGGPEMAVAQTPSYTEGGIPTPGDSSWLSNYRESAGRVGPAPVAPPPSPVPAAQSRSVAPAAQTPLDRDDRAARIRVRVPAGAEVWIDGTKTSQQGEDRRFVSPALEPGKEYYYDLHVVWGDGRRTFDENRRVVLHAGDLVNLDFTRTAPAAKATASAKLSR
jgi:uncharacterized protein (TIGR03000 family)